MGKVFYYTAPRDQHHTPRIQTQLSKKENIMPKTGASKIGPMSRKLQPKLRMIANCSTKVNTIRAEQSAAVAVVSKKVLKEIPKVRGNEDVPVTQQMLPKSAKRGHLEKLSDDVLTNVFIETSDVADTDRKLPTETVPFPRKGTLATGTVSLADLKKLVNDERVTYIEMGEALAAPAPLISPDKVSAPYASTRRMESSHKHRGGAGVLIGIIDVQGFDFAHPDFLDKQGQTRFVRIWDQGGDARPSPHARKPKAL